MGGQVSYLTRHPGWQGPNLSTSDLAPKRLGPSWRAAWNRASHHPNQEVAHSIQDDVSLAGEKGPQTPKSTACVDFREIKSYGGWGYSQGSHMWHLSLMLVSEAYVKGLWPQPRWVQRGQRSGSRLSPELTTSCAHGFGTINLQLLGWVSGQGLAPQSKIPLLLGEPSDRGCSVSRLMERKTGEKCPNGWTGSPQGQDIMPTHLWVPQREGSETVPVVWASPWVPS